MQKSILLLALAALIAFVVPLSSLKAQDLVSLQQAVNTAQSLYPSAKVIKAEIASTAMLPHYIVTLDNGKAVYINAVTGEVIQVVATGLPQTQTGGTLPNQSSGGTQSAAAPNIPNNTFAMLQALQASLGGAASSGLVIMPLVGASGMPENYAIIVPPQWLQANISSPLLSSTSISIVPLVGASGMPENYAIIVPPQWLQANMGSALSGNGAVFVPFTTAPDMTGGYGIMATQVPQVNRPSALQNGRSAGTFGVPSGSRPPQMNNSPAIGAAAPPAGAPSGPISYAQAVQAAQSLFPNTAVVNAKFEQKYGRASVWEVKLSNGYKVYVDAATGGIIRYYQDESHGNSWYSQQPQQPQPPQQAWGSSSSHDKDKHDDKHEQKEDKHDDGQKEQKEDEHDDKQKEDKHKD